MFRNGSPYSPFFTSGLLCHDDEPKRRGSFPTDSPICFTIQPRSFLSLDLAEPRARKAQIPEHKSLRLRRSRDSMRTIPSPKPAPSITLPDIPRATDFPVPPSIPVSAIVVSRTKAPVDVTELSSSNSAASFRKANRSHALARLEGRTNSTRRKAKPIKRNFMSMSDEDSEGDDDELFEAETRKFALDIINEPEDLVLPPPLLPSAPKSLPISGRFLSSIRPKSVASPRKRHTKTKDWFPLKSFIDLQSGDDDAAKFSWRSFIEVAKVS